LTLFWGADMTDSIMPAMPHRRARFFGALFLLAVLGQPLALSGHHHHVGGLAASPIGCSICAVSAHAPALSPPAMPALELPLVSAAPVLQTASAPSRTTLSPRAARAPPFWSCTIVA